MRNYLLIGKEERGKLGWTAKTRKSQSGSAYA